MKNLPIEFLRDIVLACLFGKAEDHTELNFIGHPDLEYEAKWDDLIKVREHIVTNLRTSDDGNFIRISYILKEIYDELNSRKLP